jgi:hypothetical protein
MANQNPHYSQILQDILSYHSGQPSDHQTETTQRNEHHYIFPEDPIEKFLNEKISNLHIKAANKHQITEKILHDCFGTSDYKAAVAEISGVENGGTHAKVCGKIFEDTDVGVYCQDCAM